MIAFLIGVLLCGLLGAGHGLFPRKTPDYSVKAVLAQRVGVFGAAIVLGMLFLPGVLLGAIVGGGIALLVDRAVTKRPTFL